jgi:excisionase family DNA binding protein
MFKSYPDVLSVKDLQEALGIGKSAAYALLETREIPSFRIGRVFKIPKDALIKYIRNQSC